MSEKRARQIRKEINALRRNNACVANELVRELLSSPLKYRFLFAIKLIFKRV